MSAITDTIADQIRLTLDSIAIQRSGLLAIRAAVEASQIREAGIPEFAAATFDVWSGAWADIQHAINRLNVGDEKLRAILPAS